MLTIQSIIVNNLSKYFDQPKRRKGKSSNEGELIRAVDEVSFKVEKGEIFGFLGPNGAGKTTTIRMMTGILKPTKGTIEIFDYNVWKNPLPVKQITGNVPEMANVYIDLTGWQNLSFIGELYGLNKQQRIKKAEYLLKKFDLYEKKDLKSSKYSKGMSQRLLLCMCLMSDPKILFLDEPTSGLDVQSSRIIKQLIKEYNKEGVTVFLTTHDMEVASELCDRIAIINHGKIISLDTPENLKRLTQDYLAIDCNFYDNGDLRGIKDLKHVIEIQKVEDGVHIIVEDIHEAVCEIIDFCRSCNLRIKQISTHEPKLEEAFLKIIERSG